MPALDDLEFLALLWLVCMAALFGLVAVIANWAERRRNRNVLPPPDVRVVHGHKRWYRVTTSRINDNGGI